mgnify:FL=1
MINNEIENLIKLISSLPGLGKRSARRIVLYLLNNREQKMYAIADELKKVAQSVKPCQKCGNLDTIEVCKICINEKRDNSLICVVENVADLWALERAGIYKGMYHVLGGNLSALDNRGPKELNIENLVKRTDDEKIKEVILANSATVDGQTTAHYIASRLKGSKVILSRLAHGLPIGGELDFLDDGTISQALKGRTSI